MVKNPNETAAIITDCLTRFIALCGIHSSEILNNVYFRLSDLRDAELDEVKGVLRAAQTFVYDSFIAARELEDEDGE